MDVEVKFEKPNIQVRFDPNHLSQVLNNLISNGLRYSAAKTNYPWVAIVVGQDDNQQQAFIDVLDVGPGVDEDQVDKLFEPFFTTDKKGTGLGLYLSKELCEANQAQLDYFRRESEGSRFRITFSHPRRKI